MNIDQLKARLDSVIADPLRVESVSAYLELLADCKAALEEQEGLLRQLKKELNATLAFLKKIYE